MVKIIYFYSTVLTLNFLPQDPGSRDPHVLWTLHGAEELLRTGAFIELKEVIKIEMLSPNLQSNVLFYLWI